MTQIELKCAQAAAFLAGEGDEWLRRNPYNHEESSSDPFNMRLAEIVNAQDRILEIGCSDGRRLNAIGQLAGVPCTLTGVDPSSEAIKAGTQHFPHLDLHVGTASHTGLVGTFEIVLFGFCLYLCDRNLLFAAVAEADRLLVDGGTLAIIDFDPPGPIKREYHHLKGIWSYKMDYSKIFLASPSYHLHEKLQKAGRCSGKNDEAQFPGDKVALSVLSKSVDKFYNQDG